MQFVQPLRLNSLFSLVFLKSYNFNKLRYNLKHYSSCTCNTFNRVIIFNWVIIIITTNRRWTWWHVAISIIGAEFFIICSMGSSIWTDYFYFCSEIGSAIKVIFNCKSCFRHLSRTVFFPTFSNTCSWKYFCLGILYLIILQDNWNYPLIFPYIQPWPFAYTNLINK